MLERPFVLPQQDTPNFTGREDEMRQLEVVLLNAKATKIAGVTGTGGVGKSALACRFAREHKTRFPDGVIGLRVDEKDVDTIAHDFARCCGEELDPDDERDASSIMQALFGQ